MSETPRIVIHNDNTEGFVSQLLASFPAADFRECNSYEALPALLDSYKPEIVYSVRFAGTPNFPRDHLFASEGLRWVANGGAGTDHFGVWDPAQVTVTNAAGVAAEMMAEYVMAGFLHFTIDVPGLLRDKAKRLWPARSVTPMKGKVLLILGLGHTGRALASRARAFEMRVIGTRANPRPTNDVDEVLSAEELMDALPLADFIAVSTPLTTATKGLLSADHFAVMKPGVILADVSRGGVVDQSALLEALKNKTLAGAVLDVFETEPLPDNSPIWTEEKVLISPHCSSVYEGWESASFDLFLQNLGNWIDGRPLFNVVNPEVGY